MESNLWDTEKSVAYENNQELFQSHLLEQYKLYVEMADKISERRNLTNGYFLTLNTLYLSIIGFLFEKYILASNKLVFYLLITIGIILCLIWWLLIKSYRDLNSAKYKVVGQLEKKLPSSPYWLAEWNELGKGKKITKYFPLTHLEKFVPAVFALLYLVFLFLN